MLFLAACAYIGAGLFGKLSRDLETLSVSRVTVTDSLELYGIAVRREQLVCSQAPAQLLVQEGERLPAGGKLAVFEDGSFLYSSGSALFFPDYDGLEYLSPDMLRPFSVQSLEAMMDEPANSQAALGRLVYDYCWYYAAFADEPSDLPQAGSCRLLFEGESQSVEGELMETHTYGGKTAILLRLCTSGDYLSLRKTGAELIFSQHTGLKLPEQAVNTDSDGSYFVYTLTAGIVERKAVEIIYKAEDYCLAALSTGADALREGNILIVSGEEIYEGRIIEP